MKNRMLFVLACTWLLATCGGGSQGGMGSQGGTGSLTGNWQIEANSSLHDNVQAFIASGALQQAGNKISGQMSISGSSCATSSTVSGSVSANTLNLQLNFNGQAVNLNGGQLSNSSTSVSLGTWQAPSGGCENGDYGSWSALREDLP